MKEDGLLCPADQKKLDEGKITELDVEASRILYKLLEKGKDEPLNIEFKKALDINGLVVLLFAGDVAPIIGEGGKNVKTLRNELGKDIRVVEDTNDIKKLASDLMYPVDVKRVSTVFKPNGEKIHKVVIHEENKKKLPTTLDQLEKILRNLLEDKKVELEAN